MPADGARHLVVQLAEQAGVPDERVGVVADAVLALLRAAERLRELDLDGTEPALGPQHW